MKIVLKSNEPEYVIRTLDETGQEKIQGPFTDDEIKRFSEEMSLRKSVVYKIKFFAITNDLFEELDKHEVVMDGRMAFSGPDFKYGVYDDKN
jgi:hypothetical protein